MELTDNRIRLAELILANPKPFKAAVNEAAKAELEKRRLQAPTPAPGAPKPPGEVGAEIKLLTAELGIDDRMVMDTSDCQTCNDYAAMLDRIGVEACKGRVHEIAGRLHDQAVKHKLTFADNKGAWLAIAARIAITHPALAAKLARHPLNPYLVLVKTAIERAEAKGPAPPAV
jgi:hypothetical protein